MINPRSSLAALFAATVRPGRITWIGLRPARREPPASVQVTIAEAGSGLVGDHYFTRSDGKRQVTLMQAEHVAAIASYLGVARVDAALLRRNLVTQGVNLIALKDKRFRVGKAVLEYTGECHPCSRMEENLGVGGYNAVRGHGGITARVLVSGEIRVGDKIVVDGGNNGDARA
jgi:MOSC domain-containing protein YiiM